MENKILYRLKDIHRKKYGPHQIVIKAPGRVNIIGEHTDYNHGLVLPFAVDQSIFMVASPNTDSVIRVTAVDIGKEGSISFKKPDLGQSGWMRFFAHAIKVTGIESSTGLNLVFGGDLPIGMGMSSSSSLTCGFIYLLNELFDLNLCADQIIKLSSKAENMTGLEGGMMDQTTIVKGRKGHALLIDFLDKTIDFLALDMKDHCFYILDSGQKHELVDTQYNQRRQACESGLSILQKKHGIKTLRHANAEMITDSILDHVTKDRCLHVVQENERVKSAVKCIKNGDISHLGPLLNKTHQSLSILYQVSTPEIDFLVKAVTDLPNVLGARIMGGGFGGSVICLVKGNISNSEADHIYRLYIEHTGLKVKVLPVHAGNGVSRIDS